MRGRPLTSGATTAVTMLSAGWTVRIATRYHERKRGRNDRRLTVAPDVAVGPSSADYFAGRDPVLERALRGL